uniref:Uncharacterized protein n=1 Tax=Arundo donax TaxID=35708 RepID=A0A0A9DR46_ARUDO
MAAAAAAHGTPPCIPMLLVTRKRNDGRRKHGVLRYGHLRQPASGDAALLAPTDEDLGNLRRRHAPRPRQVLHGLQRRLRRRYRRHGVLLLLVVHHLNAESTNHISRLPTLLHGHPTSNLHCPSSLQVTTDNH